MQTSLRFVIRILKTTVSSLATSEIAIFLLIAVAEQAGLSLALSETPKTGFVAMRPICAIACLAIFGNYLHRVREKLLFLEKKSIIAAEEENRGVLIFSPHEMKDIWYLPPKSFFYYFMHNLSFFLVGSGSFHLTFQCVYYPNAFF